VQAIFMAIKMKDNASPVLWDASDVTHWLLILVHIATQLMILENLKMANVSAWRVFINKFHQILFALHAKYLWISAQNVLSRPHLYVRIANLVGFLT
jgi:hypothetical protein